MLDQNEIRNRISTERDTMAFEIKTRNIFIDTAIFVESNFQFQSSIFQKLAELTQTKDVFIYLTEITVNEIRANIHEEIQKAEAALNSLKTKAKILKNLTVYREFFNPFDSKEAERLLLNQFESFLGQANVRTISLEKTSTSRVFSKYFSKEPPFGADKKKSEFPDAFALAALEEWCSRVDETMYVISGDNDMLEASRVSDVLHPLRKVEKFLHIFNYCSDPQSSFLTEILNNNMQKVEAEIEEQFTSLGFILIDEDGDINGVEVNQIEINEQYIIDIEDNRAELQLSATIHYSVDLSSYDYFTTIYDSAAEDVFPNDQVKNNPEFSEDIPIELTIKFKKDEPQYFEIESLILNCGDIEISVGEDLYDYR